MSELQAEKHLRDVHSIIEEFVKLGVNLTNLFPGKTPEAAAELLSNGKRSPVTSKTFDSPEGPSEKVGKYYVNYENGEPKVGFMAKQEKLNVSDTYVKAMSPEELIQLNKEGRIDRPITVIDNNGNLKTVYIAVDKELNNIATMSTEKLRMPDTLKGVELTDAQKESIVSGKPTLIKNMTNKDGESFDSVVSADALGKGLSFKSANIANKILGVDLSNEQIVAMRNGIPVKLEGLTGKNGKEFDAMVHMDQSSGKLIFDIQNNKDNKQLKDFFMGVKLTDQQKSDYALGNPILLVGLQKANNTDNKFDAFVKYDKAEDKITFNAIKLDSPIKGVSLSEEQKNILLTGNSVYVEGFINETKGSYNATLKLDPIKGLAFTFDNKIKEKVNIEVAAEVTPQVNVAKRAAKAMRM